MPKRAEEKFAVWTEGKEICWHDDPDGAEKCAFDRSTGDEVLYVFRVVSVIARKPVVQRVDQ